MKNRKQRDTGKAARLLESIGRNIDLPEEALSGYVLVEISGNREAVVEGCRGVLGYSDTLISLNAGKLIIKISGCELTVVSMQNSQAVVRGVISGIEYCN